MRSSVRWTLRMTGLVSEILERIRAARAARRAVPRARGFCVWRVERLSITLGSGLLHEETMSQDRGSSLFAAGGNGTLEWLQARALAERKRDASSSSQSRGRVLRPLRGDFEDWASGGRSRRDPEPSPRRPIPLETKEFDWLWQGRVVHHAPRSSSPQRAAEDRGTRRTAQARSPNRVTLLSAS